MDKRWWAIVTIILLVVVMFIISPPANLAPEKSDKLSSSRTSAELPSRYELPDTEPEWVDYKELAQRDCKCPIPEPRLTHCGNSPDFDFRVEMVRECPSTCPGECEYQMWCVYRNNWYSTETYRRGQVQYDVCTE